MNAHLMIRSPLMKLVDESLYVMSDVNAPKLLPDHINKIS